MLTVVQILFLTIIMCPRDKLTQWSTGTLYSALYLHFKYNFKRVKLHE